MGFGSALNGVYRSSDKGASWTALPTPPAGPAFSQGVRFQLRSLGTEDTSLAVTPDVHGSEPWTLIELPWSSGNGVQELQVCLVRLLSDQLENKIKGTTWVDDVALVPESAEHLKP